METKQQIKQYEAWISFLEQERNSYEAREMPTAMQFMTKHIEDYTQRIQQLLNTKNYGNY